MNSLAGLCAGAICASAHLWRWVGLGSLCLAAVLSAPAATITENFSTDPSARGWQAFGDASLFHWNSANQNLEATWDSSHTNSYFRLPLGTILDRNDDFSVAFDARFSDIAAGVNPAKSSTFPLCIGFQNFFSASKTNYVRGSGHGSPNLAEFAYFPDTGFQPTIWPTLWSTNSVLNYNGSSDYTLLGLPVGVSLHITYSYAAASRTCTVTVTTNGNSIGPINTVTLTSTFTDFRVDTFAIESFSDVGQNPQFSGSVLAHGVVDNIVITIPQPPVQNFAGTFAANHWQTTFISRTNWLYTLERAPDLQTWSAVSTNTPGNGGTLTLTDSTNYSRQYYRINAQRPN